MLPPGYYDRLTDDILELYGKLDQTILRDIVRRLVKTGRITSTAQWQIIRGQDSGLLYQAILEAAAKTAGRSEAEIRRIFAETGQTAVEYDSKIYKAAGLSPPPLALSPQAARVLESGLQKTSGYLRNLTMTTALGAQQAYITASALAEMQIESGAFDYVTSIRNAIRQAAAGGQWVLYPTGHKDRLDVAVRRAVLTGVGQTSAQIGLAYAGEMGCDLVEVTAHAGARPSHAAWQGKIYSRSGIHPKYPPFAASTGYGTGPGLCGWNCRHSFYPYFEGLSQSAYPREEIAAMNNAIVAYNGETIPLYEATQRQRAMERRIRDTKRELAGLDEGMKTAADDELKQALREDFAAKSAVLKRQETAYKDFVYTTGLQKDTSRVQVQGFGRSQAQKALWAAKKHAEGLSPRSKGDIIKEIQPEPIKIAFSPAETIQQAEEYARNVLEIPHVDYRGLDIATVNAWNEGLADTFSRFPELRERFGFVGECHRRNQAIRPVAEQYFLDELIQRNPRYSIELLKPYAKQQADEYMRRCKVSRNCVAQSYSPKVDAFKQFRGITVNRDKGKDAVSLLGIIKKDVSSRFHPENCDTIRSVLDHEIGHQLDDMLDISGQPNIQHLYDNLTLSQITKQLSEYAWKNENPEKYREFVAEAWSEFCNSPKPRSIAKAVGETIERRYAEWKKKNL